MAARKSITTKISARPTRRRVVKKRTSFFSSGLFFNFFLGLLFLLIVYSQKKTIAKYLGFYSDKITYTEARAMPIHQVLDCHIEKSFGIDLSEYQNKVNWGELNEIEGGYPLEFVFIRATAGTKKKDKLFKKHWQSAKEKKLVCGAYHYYRPNENSITQAQNFINQVTLNPGDFPPILDIERLPKAQSISRLKIGLKRWLQKVEQHYGVKPIIYSSESYYTDFLKDDFEQYPFWIANYTAFYKDIPNEWSIWQFSESGKVIGINGPVDINIYNGNSVQMKEILIK